MAKQSPPSSAQKPRLLGGFCVPGRFGKWLSAQAGVDAPRRKQKKVWDRPYELCVSDPIRRITGQFFAKSQVKISPNRRFRGKGAVIPHLSGAVWGPDHRNALLHQVPFPAGSFENCASSYNTLSCSGQKCYHKTRIANPRKSRDLVVCPEIQAAYGGAP